jgi:hypothetical protein
MDPGGVESVQQQDRANGSSDNVETLGRWVTVRQAANHVDRSVDWVRRQYRSGAVDSRTQAGRYGPERLVDIGKLEALAEAPKTGSTARPPKGGPAPAAQLPVLAETLHELAHQLGEAQERAARAEADAEELRRKLAEAEQAAEAAEAQEPQEPQAPERELPDDEAPDPDASLWLAANGQFLRTLPGAGAREAAGERLSGGPPIKPADRTRPRWWMR